MARSDAVEPRVMTLGLGPSVSGQAVDARVRAAIGGAAAKTGVDFGYLLAQAKSESGLNPAAHASGSSAAGLYQFLDQSWLGVVRQHGAEHGLGWAAAAIEAKPGGGFTVADPSLRRAVFDLREQPEASALMAAAYASDNADGLRQALGRTPDASDLYMAHFLGLGGAKTFLKAAAANPGAAAADLFPHEAAANRSIFYADGRPRSFADIREVMARKLGDAGHASAIESTAAGSTATDFAAAAAGFNLEAGAVAAPPTTAAMLASADPTSRALNLLRPNPASARLAYMMLTTLNAGASIDGPTST